MVALVFEWGSLWVGGLYHGCFPVEHVDVLGYEFCWDGGGSVYSIWGGSCWAAAEAIHSWDAGKHGMNHRVGK